MTNQQILEGAIHKAVANGWATIWAASVVKWKVEADGVHWGDMYITRKMAGRELYRIFPADVIFNHDFAKALWGDEPEVCSQCERHHRTSLDCDCGGWPDSAIKSWQYHLQQMIIAADPIKYLGEHLPK